VNSFGGIQFKKKLFYHLVLHFCWSLIMTHG
jgi:hypothetical protein